MCLVRFRLRFRVLEWKAAAVIAKDFDKEYENGTCIRSIFDGGRDRGAYIDHFLEAHETGWVATVIEEIARSSRIDYVEFEVLSDLVWAARIKGLPVQHQLKPEDLSGIGSKKKHWAAAVMLLQAARFDFNYREVRRITSLLTGCDEYFGEFKAYKLFSRLASAHDSVEESEVASFLERDIPLKIRHLVLHGMWLDPEGRYSELMIELANRILDDEPRDVVAMLRLAEAYRRQHRYQEAIRSLDRGIDLNDPSNVRMHDDFTRQRVVTNQEWQIWNAVQEHQASLDTQLLEYSENLREEQYAMLFRIVEILGLFFAIVGIFATSISLATLGELAAGQRVLIIASGGGVLACFVLLLHFILKPRDENWTKLVLETIRRKEFRKMQKEIKQDIMSEIFDMLENSRRNDGTWRDC